jgi:hypothetical protein
MGLYGFKERFVAKILAGEKTHTIRAKRKYPDKAGNKLHLYVGLRQPNARLLMRPLCTKVERIEIAESGCIFVGGVLLEPDEQEQLARRDGFESHAQMMQFWEGRLPFDGQIIHWRKQ